MSHEGIPQAEDGNVDIAFARLFQLVGFNALAEFIIGDTQLGQVGSRAVPTQGRKLAIAPSLQGKGCAGVVAVDVNDRIHPAKAAAEV